MIDSHALLPIRHGPRRAVRRAVTLAAAAVGGLLGLSGAATAAPSFGDTRVLEVRLGSQRSELMDTLRFGGYELADGTAISFENWYKTRMPELDFRFITPLGPNMGFTWGFSTGERGEKYTIDPALRIGLLYRIDLDRARWVTLSMTTVLGGNLREAPCTADFGAIGGVQSVNCRLAATPLPPQETLQYLIRQSGFRETRISISFTMQF